MSFRTSAFPCDPRSPTKFTTCSAERLDPRYRATAEFFNRALAAPGERQQSTPHLGSKKRKSLLFDV